MKRTFGAFIAFCYEYDCFLSSFKRSRKGQAKEWQLFSAVSFKVTPNAPRVEKWFRLMALFKMDLRVYYYLINQD